MKTVHIYRRDDRNVGDFHCAPHRYFDLPAGPVRDIFDDPASLGQADAIIVGGGGLGRSFFAKALTQLARADRPYNLIAWGVGSDTVMDKTGAALPEDRVYDLFSPYFDAFDEVGTRSWNEARQAHRWVPCVSAMHEAFDRFRDRKPTKLIGHYQHKNFRFAPSDQMTSIMANNGNDLEQKLEFLADHEFIVSNTYHGVYWATLLGRKVLCLPFKSGLFSFRHRPAMIPTAIPNEEDLHRAQGYGNSLEDCRGANISYREHLSRTYGI